MSAKGKNGSGRPHGSNACKTDEIEMKIETVYSQIEVLKERSGNAIFSDDDYIEVGKAFLLKESEDTRNLIHENINARYTIRHKTYEKMHQGIADRKNKFVMTPLLREFHTRINSEMSSVDLQQMKCFMDYEMKRIEFLMKKKNDVDVDNERLLFVAFNKLEDARARKLMKVDGDSQDLNFVLPDDVDDVDDDSTVIEG